MYRQSRLIEWIKQTVPNEIEHLINLPSEMFALIARGEINFARRKRTVEVVDSVHDKKKCNRLPAVDIFLRLVFSHEPIPYRRRLRRCVRVASKVRSWLYALLQLATGWSTKTWKFDDIAFSYTLANHPVCEFDFKTDWFGMVCASCKRHPSFRTLLTKLRLETWWWSVQMRQ